MRADKNSAPLCHAGVRVAVEVRRIEKFSPLIRIPRDTIYFPIKKI